MALVTTKEMFKKAYAGGYAIGAFNINNMEIIQAITEAAAEEKSPVVLQVSAGARKYAKHAYLMASLAQLLRTAALISLFTSTTEQTSRSVSPASTAASPPL